MLNELFGQGQSDEWEDIPDVEVISSVPLPASKLSDEVNLPCPSFLMSTPLIHFDRKLKSLQWNVTILVSLDLKISMRIISVQKSWNFKYFTLGGLLVI
jgi:hypothetical protein